MRTGNERTPSYYTESMHRFNKCVFVVLLHPIRNALYSDAAEESIGRTLVSGGEVRPRSSSAVAKVSSDDPKRALFPCSREIITEFRNLLIDTESNNMSIIAFLFNL